MAEKASEKKPAAKKETAKKAPAVKKEAAKKAPAAKKAEPVVKTVLQVNGKDYDLSTFADDLLKEYKSVHKRKAVSEFVVYVKPEENAAYYTVNGEGSDEFKKEL